MRKFIQKILLFVTMLIVLVTVTFYAGNYYNRYEYEYLAAIQDKHHLAQEIGSTPKIILAGGSNVAFGLLAEDFQNAYNRPALNMGIYVGLGLEYILNELVDVANPNDIILLSLEYDTPIKPYPGMNYHVFRYLPESIFYFDDDKTTLTSLLASKIQKDVFWMTKFHYYRMFKNSDFKLNDFIYKREMFNSNGDAVGYHHLSSQLDAGNSFSDTVTLKSNWDNFHILNDFAIKCEQKDITAFLCYAPLVKENYKRDSGLIAQFTSYMNKNIRIDFLDTPKEVVFKRADFYDTKYHLLEKAKKIRTGNLIRLLKERL